MGSASEVSITGSSNWRRISSSRSLVYSGEFVIQSIENIILHSNRRSTFRNGESSSGLLSAK